VIPVRHLCLFPSVRLHPTIQQARRKTQTKMTMSLDHRLTNPPTTMTRFPYTCFLIALILGALLSSCDRSDNSSDATKWVDPNQLKAGPIRHASLTDEQMSRVQRLQQTFREVDPSTVEKWAEDFRRDANPEREMAVWESMATAYETFTASKSLTLDGKEEVYQVVLLRSGAPEDQVLKRLKLKILTEKDARAIMALFATKPQPITISP
jgi:hypothetical protein